MQPLMIEEIVIAAAARQSLLQRQREAEQRERDRERRRQRGPFWRRLAIAWPRPRRRSTFRAPRPLNT